MENKKSKGILIGFVVSIITLVGGFFLGQYLSNENVDSLKKETKEIKAENKDMKSKLEKYKTSESKNTYSYSDMVGVYEYVSAPSKDEMENEYTDLHKLVLYENGMFHYYEYRYADAGHIGNYVIENGEIKLSSLFKHGSDVALNVDTTIKKSLKISSKTLIIDPNPLDLSYKEGNNTQSKIELKKTDEQVNIDDLNRYLNDYGIFNNEREK